MRRTLALAFALLLPALPAAAAAPAAATAPPATRSVPAGTPKSEAPVLAPPADSAAVIALLEGVQNRACPLPGVATGGQPAASHLSALAKAGYRTVIDLRAADEARGYDEAAAMKSAGLTYVRIPVTLATLTDSTYATFRRAMDEHGPAGVFVHCASANRVGGVMVPWLVLDRGWDLERAVATARASGMHTPELETRARDYVARMRAAKR